VGQLWDDITQAYDERIQVPGKEIHFLILLAFLCSFGFIRGSAHMIRAQVSWWPGNVETKSGMHIHHLVWGILLLITMGYLGLAFDFGDPWLEFVAIAFGIGLGLTLDEFALWLNLEDVYWQDKGRESIDAVVVMTALLVLTLLGLQFWIDIWKAVLDLVGVDRNGVLLPTAVQVAAVPLAVITFMKGRKLVGIIGLFVPLVALVGALLPATEGSRWERRRRAHSSV
jgi:hypothetical protein